MGQSDGHQGLQEKLKHPFHELKEKLHHTHLEEELLHQK